MSAVERFFTDLATHADRPALDDGRTACTYLELLAHVDRWEETLATLGVGRVAWRLPNGPAWIALDLALLRSGRVGIPVPEFFTTAQQAHLLNVSGADLYVAPQPPPTQDFQRAANGPEHSLWVRRVPDQPALHAGTAKITFTSGSTGAPKGVCLAAEQQLATAAALRVALGQQGITRHLSALPLALLLENVAGVYASLANGSLIDVPPTETLGLQGSSGLDLARFAAAQCEHQPHSLILVPQLLLALTAAREFGMDLPDSYRFVAVGGGKVAPSLIERARRAGIPAFEGYGLTECGSVVAVNLPGRDRPGTVGQLLPHVTCGIVDGEIHLIGNTMLGYVGEPAVSGHLATGDLGSLDDGFLSVSGRRRNGFITAFGRNVNPEWIESELTAELAIGHAAVFGEAQPANVALLVARAGFNADAVAAAVAAANERLPDYARIAAWRLVDATAFAAAGCLTDNGRPRRNVIARHFDAAVRSMYANLEEHHHAAIRQAGLTNR